MLDTKAPVRDPLPAQLDWVLNGHLSDDGESRTIVIAPFPFRIGRRPGLSLTLPRQTVSSVHAELFERDRRLVLRDLKSTNGTFVNGQRINGEKVLSENDLIQFADAPFRVYRYAEETPSATRTKDACDQALAIVQFEQILSGKGIVPYYQPIIDLETGQLLAFEALARSRLVGLETPAFMFNAATQLRQTTELSQVLRRVAVAESVNFPDLPHLFLNTHPSELDTPALLRSCEELRKIAARQPITIEIHEGAVSNVNQMIELRRGLDDLDMKLAFDDFGAGQARLAELAEVRPHYLKFDRSMIRQLHMADPSRRRIVSGFVQMIKEFNILSLAEGIETAEERDACLEAGFVLAQGYFHGRPMPVSHYKKASSVILRTPDAQSEEPRS
ncbi:MAG: EAL domain-containing protein [Planctomycetaceae bacterium]|nr:EAL domain-containing protein [Planctomycetaceae bacterium]